MLYLRQQYHFGADDTLLMLVLSTSASLDSRLTPALAAILGAWRV
jgi:hypothetical protein